METFEFALVIVFWAAVVLAATSLLTPAASFLTKTRDRVHGLVSWLSVAVVAGGLNLVLGETNTIF